MNKLFDRWFSQEFAPLSPEQRGPTPARFRHNPAVTYGEWLRQDAPALSYHDLRAMVENPDIAHHMIEQHRWTRQLLSMAPGAVNEPVREPERIVLDRAGRCQWCGGRVGNVTNCPNCGGPP